MIKTNVKYSYFIWPELSVMLQHPLLRFLVGFLGDPEVGTHIKDIVLLGSWPLVMFTITFLHEFRGVPSVLVHDIHLLSLTPLAAAICTITSVAALLK